jgi:LemA protein
MTDSVLVWLAIAVFLFWSMGAYNRLVRLRSQGLVAFGALEAPFNQYILLVKNNIPDVRETPDADGSGHGNDSSHAAWAGLAAAAEQFSASLKVAHAHPLNGPTTSALKTAFDTLCLSWSRLQDLPPDLAGSALPAALQSQWEHIGFQAEMARAEFNRTVTNYNEAINQFPALLLAGMFGFKPAQPI